jgi:nucleoside-triphosphatase THEP1
MMQNEHVPAYLSRYLQQPSNYAVLVTGKWGAGKTFIVNRFLKSANQAHIYVSVNGARDTEEVRRRMLYAAYPVFGDKTMQALGSLGKSALGMLRFNVNLEATDLLSLDSVRLLVIDDVERSLCSIEELLGFLNSFVEQESKHLILLGNEDELETEENYRKIKEKTIGFTVRVTPEPASALASFAHSVPSPGYRQFLLDHAHELRSTFEASGSHNLRVLKQTLAEMEEIHTTLASLKPDESVSVEVLRLYLAVSVWHKEGRISRSDINGRSVDHLARIFASNNDTRQKSKFDLLDERFTDLDLFSGVIDNEYMEAKLCDGLHVEEHLTRSVKDALAKDNPSSNPEWRNLWYYMRNPDEVTKSSFLEFSQKFAGRQYLDAGIILHAFGLHIEMAKAGLSNWNKGRIKKECRKYVDDLAGSGSLPEVRDDYLSAFRHGAAHGLGFTNSADPLFRELYNYFMRKSSEVRSARLVKAVNDAAYDLEGRGLEFRKLILQSNEENLYSSPVLHRLDPVKFADRLIGCSGDVQFDVLQSLGDRYKDSPYPDVVKSELGWLKKVVRRIKQQLPSLDSLAAYRMRQMLAWFLPQEAIPKKSKAARAQTSPGASSSA